MVALALLFRYGLSMTPILSKNPFSRSFGAKPLEVLEPVRKTAHKQKQLDLDTSLFYSEFDRYKFIKVKWNFC